MALIEVRDLVKRYRKADANAVDGVSFTVDAGDLFCLIGPNGAGKTTTVSVLTTTLLPTSGSVLIAGHDVAADPAAVRSQAGIIFQAPSLDLNLTAEENVRFHAVLFGVYPWRPLYRLMPRAYRDHVGELAGVLGIEDALGKPVKTFSGGMRRKLEIVRTLMHRPKVLFLDEPTTGLDPASRRDLWSYLAGVRAEHGTTVFLTTHYLEEAEGADRLCMLNRGRVVAAGTPGEVTRALAQAYLLLDARDRPALVAELRRAGLDVLGDGPFRVLLDGERSAQSVIRSLDVELSMLESRAPSVEDAYMSLVASRDEP